MRLVAGEALERGAGALLAEIARDRRGQFLDRHRRAPQPEARRHRRQAGRHEHVGLHPLDGGRRAPRREGDGGDDVEREAPHHAVDQRRQVDAEQMLRPQQVDAPRPGGEEARIGEGRQQQRVGPGQDADRHPGDGAAGGGVAPDQADEEGRRELRDRGERQDADGGELAVAGEAVIHVGEQQDREDRQPPHLEQQRADVLAAGDQRLAPLQHPRHHDVVRHHDGERDRLDDHHGGRGRQPADEGQDGENARSGMQRQRQHEHVAVDLAAREGHQAGDGDRHDEQVDQHQIDREHPARALDLALVVVLDHRDVELPRQQKDRDERQQRAGEQRVERRLAGQHRSGHRRVHRLAEQARPGRRTSRR